MSQKQKEYAVDKITRPPIHPGEIFAEEVMPELRKKRTIGEIARVLGVSRAEPVSHDGREDFVDSRHGGQDRRARWERRTHLARDAG